MLDLERTVVAIATPPGRGGLGALRLSGPRAFEIARAVFLPHRAGARAEPGGRPVFGRFLSADGEPADRGFLVLFDARRSYTGEPTAELWVHGSPAVLRVLADAILARGGTAAGPGEFTYRAVRRGRLDLARAEGVRDLIAARTSYQARVAFAQSEGALSRRIGPLRERLVDLTARAEAAVEFVDESEVSLPGSVLAETIDALRGEAAAVLRGFRSGRLVREGALVAITGLPNVGKSSLFNALLSRERAIVSPVPGTTRDTLEETIDLEGIPARLVDTAGLRDARDPVESEGVRRARGAAEEADLVLLVLDGSRSLAASERAALEAGRSGAKPCVAVLNKCDLPRAGARHPDDAIPVSARTGEGLGALRVALRTALTGEEMLEDPVLTDARQAEELARCEAALASAGTAVRDGFPEELVLEDLRSALDALGAITGEFGGEELYDRIFTTFCIGK